MDYKKQIRAIRYAIKELQKEAIRYSGQASMQYYLDEIGEHIEHLNNAVKVIEAMGKLHEVFNA